MLMLITCMVRQWEKKLPVDGFKWVDDLSKLNIEIVDDLMINGLSSKYKHKFRIKPYGGEISEDFVKNIFPTVKRKPDVIAIHIGTNNITNDDFSSRQININKVRKLVIELSPSTKIVLLYVMAREISM